MKADFEMIKEFQNTVETKIVKQLDKKIDKIEHKRVQKHMSKKIESV